MDCGFATELIAFVNWCRNGISIGQYCLGIFDIDTMHNETDLRHKYSINNSCPPFLPDPFENDLPTI